ncbi:MAG: zinc ribbon domain-containing protein [Verrucomicrobiota bacterium]
MNVDHARGFGTRECPGCATEVPANNNRCPLCGYEFPHPTPTQMKLKWVGVVIMLGVLIALILRVL